MTELIEHDDVSLLRALPALLAAGRWQSFMERDPEAMQVVLVHSEGWKFPKVLQFVPWGISHRLYEVEGDRFYYYPERMHWMPIPPKP